ncbi:unnamed protein product [Gongylonema pulchrum]|uniref:MTOR-associated protein MEAK7 n=1 Tax=Gongylonema pulchrum TaxID=637853 RepID=A0A183F0T2_9BILA|nr:unnamed protein product [Gongylonema pulchrum]
MKSIDGTGPCLIVIETASGRVFGAFASQGFRCGPTHTGDNRCFLFEDKRKLQIHNATGYNSNFGYLNSHQLTMPNGIAAPYTKVLENKPRISEGNKFLDVFDVYTATTMIGNGKSQT